MKAAIIYLNTKARTIADIESALVIRSLYRQDNLSQVEIAALLHRVDPWLSGKDLERSASAPSPQGLVRRFSPSPGQDGRLFVRHHFGSVEHLSIGACSASHRTDAIGTGRHAWTS
jgi:hypothetical protein